MAKKPIKLGSVAFLKLQRKWYRKVAKAGHVDVERFIDMNKLPITTMPRAHGPFLYQPDTDELEEDFIALADTDKAGFWRMVGRKAAEMPASDRDFDLICAFAEEGTYSDAGQAVGISYSQAKSRIKKWLKANDLPDIVGATKTPQPKQPEPGPCRTLTAAEIAKLRYTQPRKK